MDFSTESCSTGSTESCSTDVCFLKIEELNKFRLNDDSVEKQYKVIEKLGDGGFGAVFKVQHKFDKNFYAIKFVSKLLIIIVAFLFLG
jgi:serine/threonine protein kinase